MKINLPYIFLVGLHCAFSLSSVQAQITPQWLSRVPPQTETYYYRVSQATAQTEESALKMAFAMAIYESAFAFGVAVDIKQLEQMTADSALATLSKYVKIPVNVVCKYTEPLVATSGYKGYVLCQVANDARIQPKYKTFNCFWEREEKEEDKQ
jgi:ABC-type uncharacterized transport system YnjBCD permease subunit